MLSISLPSTTIVHTSETVLQSHKIPFLLGLLNNLNAKLKQPSVKSWKDTKAKLIARIVKNQKAIAEANTHVVPTAVAKGAYKMKRLAPKTKATSTKATKAKSNGKAKATSTPRDTELSKFIASLGLTPKQARGKFRKAKVKKVEKHYVLNAETRKALAA